MFTVGPRDVAALEPLRQTQAAQPFTYDEVGATRGDLPTGYRHDHHVAVLGAGDGVYQRAVEGLRRWETHHAAGIALCPPRPPIEAGVTLVQAIRLPLITALAACRIVYVVDEPDRFGFAYGTLPAHPEAGEEAFIVERDGDDVRFVITAFSRTRHPLARICGPVARRIQLGVTRQYLDGLRRFAASER